MYILDTHVLAELRPGRPGASKAVLAWAAGEPQSRFFVSAVTVLEIETGLRGLERRQPPQGSALRAWFEALRKAFAGRILPFTEDAALRCAPMHVPDRSDYRDAMIAATALCHGYAVVTRNVRDFERLGVAIINPWDFGGEAP